MFRSRWFLAIALIAGLFVVDARPVQQPDVLDTSPKTVNSPGDIGGLYWCVHYADDIDSTPNAGDQNDFYPIRPRRGVYHNFASNGVIIRCLVGSVNVKFYQIYGGAIDSTYTTVLNSDPTSNNRTCDKSMRLLKVKVWTDSGTGTCEVSYW